MIITLYFIGYKYYDNFITVVTAVAPDTFSVDEFLNTQSKSKSNPWQYYSLFNRKIKKIQFYSLIKISKHVGLNVKCEKIKILLVKEQTCLE